MKDFSIPGQYFIFPNNKRYPRRCCRGYSGSFNTVHVRYTVSGTAVKASTYRSPLPFGTYDTQVHCRLYYPKRKEALA